MADSITVKTEGFKELEQLLVQMGEDLCYGKTASRVLIPAVKTAMQPVLAQARATVPYDESNSTTKHLRDSLRLYGRVPNAKDMRSDSIDKNTIAIAVVSVRSDKRGISQEFGNAFNQYQLERQARLNPLQSLTGVGQSTAATMAHQAGQFGQNMAQNAINMGNIRASSYMNTANALTGALGTGLNYYQNKDMMKLYGPKQYAEPTYDDMAAFSQQEYPR